MDNITKLPDRSLGFEMLFASCDNFHLLNAEQIEDYFIWKKANPNKMVNTWSGWKIYI